MARKMKDSGIEWIGEIPEGWTKNKVIRLFDTIGSGTTPKNVTSDFPVVNWIQSGDITGSFMPACKNVISANLLSQYSALKVYPAPFIIIAMYGASVGNASISLIDGCVNQACCVLSSPSCNLHYAFYVIKSAQSYLVRKAVGGGQPNISQETIKQLWLPLPPLSTQDIIVRNLDAICSKIDNLLSSVHASIEEYKKLKQAVITQAVTKGVRGEREMKDSGVEWIGRIPKEWDILNLVAHTSMLTPMRDRPENLDGPIPWIRIEDFDGKYISSSKASLGVSKETVRSMNLKIYPVGTILCTSSCIMGKCAIVSRELVSNQRFIGIIPDQNTCENFLYYLMLSNSERMNYLATGALQANLSRSSFEHLKVQFPSYQEQKEISDYLDTKCAEIDKLIAKKEQLVKELESYKKSLIYEVVTGKREV